MPQDDWGGAVLKRFFPFFQIFFNDPAQDPAEDVFLTELRTQVQESVSQRGACIPPR